MRSRLVAIVAETRVGQGEMAERDAYVRCMCGDEESESWWRRRQMDRNLRG